MTLVECIRIAVLALVVNRLRTFLTMLGIIIGVCSVITLISIGQGAQQQVAAQIRSLGTNLLFVRPIRGHGSGAALTVEDAEALGQQVPTVLATAPEQVSDGQIVAKDQNIEARIVGTTPEYTSIRNHGVDAGEFLTRPHIESRANVVVLGSKAAEELFGDDNPVGQSIRISIDRATAHFRVIGVMESKGGGGLGYLDDQIFIPITTMQARLVAERGARGGANVWLISVQVTSERQMADAMEQITAVLRERHKVAEDDFLIQSQEDFAKTFTQTSRIFTTLLGSIAGISLLVGGIGIMNIMLVSVTERTREIGIRKAVGARPRDILSQFLVESVTVSLCGGLIGVLLGWGMSRLIATVEIPDLGASLPRGGLEAVVAPESVLLAFLVSTAIGIFFGMYPAARAARLRPIEALRYE